jgi:20S proteasome alpha/beta subunit
MVVVDGSWFAERWPWLHAVATSANTFVYALDSVEYWHVADTVFRKINRNVVVGFAGDTLAAVQIINAVDEYQTQYLTLEKVVKILREKAATVSVQPVGVRLIVGGRNRKGVFTMTMMGSVDGYEPQTQAARKGAYLIEGACSHTDVAPWLEEEVKPQAANWHSLDDVAHTLDGCIAKMAKLDKSINTTYFRQLVM